MSIFLGLVGLSIVAWYLAKIAWRVWVDLHVILGTPRRTPVDVSNAAHRRVPYIQELIVALESLGYHRLGEAKTSLPYIQSTPTWILMSEDNVIQAEIAVARVSFSTYFDDNVVVETGYPTGEHLQTPTFQSRTITTNLQDALKYHQVQVENFTVKYGAPQRISSMDDYLRWDRIYRENYGLVKMKRLLVVDVVRLVTLVYGVIILILVPRFGRGSFSLIPSNITQAEMELILLGLTLPILPVQDVLSRSVLRGIRRDSRKMR